MVADCNIDQNYCKENPLKLENAIHETNRLSTLSNGMRKTEIFTQESISSIVGGTENQNRVLKTQKIWTLSHQTPQQIFNDIKNKMMIKC